jgi:ABC-2 type transport system ATP-binding protein
MAVIPEPVLALRALGKRYGRRRVLDGLDLEVGRGEVVGLLGPNGSGKTTTLRLAAGYLWPDAGQVSLCGRHLDPATPALRARIGYAPERPPLYEPFTVAEYLGFVASARGLRPAERHAAVARVCAECDLEAVRGRIIGQLSKGLRQRVGLAQALIAAPDLILLDEPTSGLDPFQIVEARALIRRAAHDRAVLLSTHLLQEVAALCTRIVFLRDGRLLEVPVGTAHGDGESVVQALVRGPDPAALRQALSSAGVDWVLEGDEAYGPATWRYRLRGQTTSRAALARCLAASGDLLELGEAGESLERRLASLCAEPG